MEAVATSTAASPLIRHTAGASAGISSLAAVVTRAVGRRGPSALVRQTAGRHLERQRADWSHSQPVIALDIAWNLSFVVAVVAVLAASTDERPSVPLRLWAAGYAAQCLVHVVIVWAEFRGRRSSPRAGLLEGGGVAAATTVPATEIETVGSDEEDGESDSGSASICESVNTVASIIWWITGFYWVISGGQLLSQEAPKLYWLTVFFLSFDIIFAIFCVVVATFIGVALCCCLPVVIAILYALPGQEGASDADISLLPLYKYSIDYADGQKAADVGIMTPIRHDNGTLTSERILLHEDAECCICLMAYEHGAELLLLPCNHHFHSPCIIKWLRIRATCPLCKYNILKAG